MAIWLLIWAGALMFAVRLFLAVFSSSPTIGGQIRRHPLAHTIWGVFSLIVFCMTFGLVPVGLDDWSERRGQRKVVNERVQSAGGWDAVRRGCELLATNKLEPFYWRPPSPRAEVTDYSSGVARHYITNIDYGPLPPAVAALKPREIRYYPPEILRQSKAESDAPVMHIRLFGGHSTGWRSQPYFGLEVVCGLGGENYRPKKGNSGGVDGNSHSTFRKVAEGVFEIY